MSYRHVSFGWHCLIAKTVCLFGWAWFKSIAFVRQSHELRPPLTRMFFANQTIMSKF
jgi:hypothetical protein